MSDPPTHDHTPDMTVALRNLARGEVDANLTEHIMRELRAIATAYLQRERSGQSLQASDLVHEAYLKLFDPAQLELKDRMHFFALAAKIMRQVLVDRARKRKSTKRGGDRDAITLVDPPVSGTTAAIDALDLHHALEDLASVDERQAQVVELRYFGGLEVSEVAEVLAVSKTTVEREWRSARAWLLRRLKNEA